MKKILLIDVSSILHAAKYGVGKKRLSNNEESTFIIYGFLLKLQYIVKKVNPHVIVFAVDSDSSNRRDIYPGYKDRKQEKTDEQKALDALAFPQFDKVINDVIPTIGYKNIFSADGFEADDVIARICLDYTKSGIIIATSDGDMYQCLSQRICIFNVGKNRYYNHVHFKEEWNCRPDQWGRVKMLAGCTSDTVKGIEGVKEKTAVKYINKDLPEHHKTYKRIISPEGKKIAQLNKRLVVLPFDGTPKFRIKNDRLKKKGIVKIAKRYGLSSILNDLMYWQGVLNIQ